MYSMCPGSSERINLVLKASGLGTNRIFVNIRNSGPVFKDITYASGHFTVGRYGSLSKPVSSGENYFVSLKTFEY